MKIIVFSGDYSAIYATGNRTRFMNAKPALAALLMTAMLFASPAAIADQRTAQEDIPSTTLDDHGRARSHPSFVGCGPTARWVAAEGHGIFRHAAHGTL